MSVPIAPVSIAARKVVVSVAATRLRSTRSTSRVLTCLAQDFSAERATGHKS